MGTMNVRSQGIYQQNPKIVVDADELQLQVTNTGALKTSPSEAMLGNEIFNASVRNVLGDILQELKMLNTQMAFLKEQTTEIKESDLTSGLNLNS
ncbi:MAG TPA: hypothetical protein VJ000_01175 [Thermodesulfovibrionia bacterium]|nr:hypothetical protein [Thermodesulfovibrionia bacterium]